MSLDELLKQLSEVSRRLEEEETRTEIQKERVAKLRGLDCDWVMAQILLEVFESSIRNIKDHKQRIMQQIRELEAEQRRQIAPSRGSVACKDIKSDLADVIEFDTGYYELLERKDGR